MTSFFGAIAGVTPGTGDSRCRAFFIRGNHGRIVCANSGFVGGVAHT